MQVDDPLLSPPLSRLVSQSGRKCDRKEKLDSIEHAPLYFVPPTPFNTTIHLYAESPIESAKRPRSHSRFFTCPLNFSPQVSSIMNRSIILSLLLLSPASAEPLSYTVTIDTPVTAPEGRYWMQTRIGAIPVVGDAKPRVVLTAQLTDNKGTHMYHDIASMWTEDMGATWSELTTHTTIGRRKRDNDLIEAPVDPSPQWHAKSGTLLLTGATFWLSEKLGRDVPGGDSSTFYSAYHPKEDTWNDWKVLKMPDDKKFDFSRAGCTQRVDLPNGDILLPIYFGEHNNSIHYATVVLCKMIDGELRYIKHGTEMKLDYGRGMNEPSLAQFGDRFFLTMRNDKGAWIATSDDGLTFSEPEPWKFDDDQPLGSANTQQRWVTHSDGLFLVYTRSGADNDDVMRNRAPLFMAQVDTKAFRVLRATEQILLPKISPEGLGVDPKTFGRFGNFGTCNVSAHETWVSAGLGGAPKGHASIYIARIRWEQPNKLVP